MIRETDWMLDFRLFSEKVKRLKVYVVCVIVDGIYGPIVIRWLRTRRTDACWYAINDDLCLRRCSYCETQFTYALWTATNSSLLLSLRVFNESRFKSKTFAPEETRLLKIPRHISRSLDHSFAFYCYRVTFSSLSLARPQLIRATKIKRAFICSRAVRFRLHYATKCRY